ncbi:MAG: hypothetical protein A2X78_05125 [Gammaproteobacteria bacterium GWE2_37_16]|nr:MAG: hypothetical protein A2X78_05125 [Gammaproteobacteria bacterium GWE2_37_16]
MSGENTVVSPIPISNPDNSLAVGFKPGQLDVDNQANAPKQTEQDSASPEKRSFLDDLLDAISSAESNESAKKTSAETYLSQISSKLGLLNSKDEKQQSEALRYAKNIQGFQKQESILIYLSSLPEKYNDNNLVLYACFLSLERILANISSRDQQLVDKGKAQLKKFFLEPYMSARLDKLSDYLAKTGQSGTQILANWDSVEVKVGKNNIPSALSKFVNGIKLDRQFSKAAEEFRSEQQANPQDPTARKETIVAFFKECREILLNTNCSETLKKSIYQKVALTIVYNSTSEGWELSLLEHNIVGFLSGDTIENAGSFCLYDIRKILLNFIRDKSIFVFNTAEGQQDFLRKLVVVARAVQADPKETEDALIGYVAEAVLKQQLPIRLIKSIMGTESAYLVLDKVAEKRENKHVVYLESILLALSHDNYLKVADYTQKFITSMQQGLNHPTSLLSQKGTGAALIGFCRLYFGLDKVFPNKTDAERVAIRESIEKSILIDNQTLSLVSATTRFLMFNKLSEAKVLDKIDLSAFLSWFGGKDKDFASSVQGKVEIVTQLNTLAQKDDKCALAILNNENLRSVLGAQGCIDILGNHIQKFRDSDILKTSAEQKPELDKLAEIAKLSLPEIPIDQIMDLTKKDQAAASSYVPIAVLHAVIYGDIANLGAEKYQRSEAAKDVVRKVIFKHCAEVLLNKLEQLKRSDLTSDQVVKLVKDTELLASSKEVRDNIKDEQATELVGCLTDFNVVIRLPQLTQQELFSLIDSWREGQVNLLNIRDFYLSRFIKPGAMEEALLNKLVFFVTSLVGIVKPDRQNLASLATFVQNVTLIERAPLSLLQTLFIKLREGKQDLAPIIVRYLQLLGAQPTLAEKLKEILKTVPVTSLAQLLSIEANSKDQSFMLGLLTTILASNNQTHFDLFQQNTGAWLTLFATPTTRGMELIKQCTSEQLQSLVRSNVRYAAVLARIDEVRNKLDAGFWIGLLDGYVVTVDNADDRTALINLSTAIYADDKLLDGFLKKIKQGDMGIGGGELSATAITTPNFHRVMLGDVVDTAVDEHRENKLAVRSQTFMPILFKTLDLAKDPINRPKDIAQRLEKISTSLVNKGVTLKPEEQTSLYEKLNSDLNLDQELILSLTAKAFESFMQVVKQEQRGVIYAGCLYFIKNNLSQDNLSDGATAKYNKIIELLKTVSIVDLAHILVIDATTIDMPDFRYGILAVILASNDQEHFDLLKQQPAAWLACFNTPLGEKLINQFTKGQLQSLAEINLQYAVCLTNIESIKVKMGGDEAVQKLLDKYVDEVFTAETLDANRHDLVKLATNAYASGQNIGLFLDKLKGQEQVAEIRQPLADLHTSTFAFANVSEFGASMAVKQGNRKAIRESLFPEIVFNNFKKISTELDGKELEKISKNLELISKSPALIELFKGASSEEKNRRVRLCDYLNKKAVLSKLSKEALENYMNLFHGEDRVSLLTDIFANVDLHYVNEGVKNSLLGCVRGVSAEGAIRILGSAQEGNAELLLTNEQHALLMGNKEGIFAKMVSLKDADLIKKNCKAAFFMSKHPEIFCDQAFKIHLQKTKAYLAALKSAMEFFNFDTNSKKIKDLDTKINNCIQQQELQDIDEKLSFSVGGLLLASGVVKEEALASSRLTALDAVFDLLKKTIEQQVIDLTQKLKDANEVEQEQRAKLKVSQDASKVAQKSALEVEQKAVAAKVAQKSALENAVAANKKFTIHYNSAQTTKSELGLFVSSVVSGMNALGMSIENNMLAELNVANLDKQIPELKTLGSDRYKTLNGRSIALLQYRALLEKAEVGKQDADIVTIMRVMKKLIEEGEGSERNPIIWLLLPKEALQLVENGNPSMLFVNWIVAAMATADRVNTPHAPGEIHGVMHKYGRILAASAIESLDAKLSTIKGAENKECAAFVDGFRATLNDFYIRHSCLNSQDRNKSVNRISFDSKYVLVHMMSKQVDVEVIQKMVAVGPHEQHYKLLCSAERKGSSAPVFTPEGVKQLRQEREQRLDLIGFLLKQDVISAKGYRNALLTEAKDLCKGLGKNYWWFTVKHDAFPPGGRTFIGKVVSFFARSYRAQNSEAFLNDMRKNAESANAEFIRIAKVKKEVVSAAPQLSLAGVLSSSEVVAERVAQEIVPSSGKDGVPDLQTGQSLRYGAIYTGLGGKMPPPSIVRQSLSPESGVVKEVVKPVPSLERTPLGYTPNDSSAVHEENPAKMNQLN